MWRNVARDRDTRNRWLRYPGIERGPPSRGRGAVGSRRGPAGSRRGAVGRGRFCLTFDDGPDLDSTPAVLDALARAGAPAAFFMVGEQVTRFPELAVEVARRGHLVGCHGHEHRHHPERPGREVVEDLRRAAAAVEVTCRQPMAWFRPPYGRFSGASWRECARRRWRPVLWSAWGLDWEPRPAEAIAAQVLADLHDGAIVLLHDSARYARRRSALPTAGAVPLIVAGAAQRGLRPAGLDELLGEPGAWKRDE